MRGARTRDEVIRLRPCPEPVKQGSRQPQQVALPSRPLCAQESGKATWRGGEASKVGGGVFKNFSPPHWGL